MSTERNEKGNAEEDEDGIVDVQGKVKRKIKMFILVRAHRVYSKLSK